MASGTKVGFTFDYVAPTLYTEPGDSGGPTFVLGDPTRPLVGVVSGRVGTRTVLARLDLVADWIAHEIEWQFEDGDSGDGGAPDEPAAAGGEATGCGGAFVPVCVGETSLAVCEDGEVWLLTCPGGCVEDPEAMFGTCYG